MVAHGGAIIPAIVENASFAVKMIGEIYVICSQAAPFVKAVSVIVAIAILLGSVSGTCSAATQMDGVSEVSHRFPCIARPERLYVISKSAMTDAELLMVSSLQGIVAQTRPEIYIDSGSAYRGWLELIRAEHGIPMQYHDEAEWFVDHYKDIFKENGYVLADLKSECVNVATTVSGLLGAPIVDQSLLPLMYARGFEMAIDVRDKDECWAFENYKDKLNPNILFRQDPLKLQLRDYAIACKGFVFYQPDNDEFVSTVYDWAQEDAPVLGWGPGFEDDHVAKASEHNHMTIPADWAMNLSALAGIGHGSLQQRNHVANIRFEPDVHYVTFVMSDGDNVQWLLGDMAVKPHHYGSAVRGKFPMGFTISPSLIGLAPAAMGWYYDTAKLDYFVAGVSGTGYIYPSKYPRLDSFAFELDQYLAMSDLSIVSILDQCPMGSKEFHDLAQAYAGLSNVIGGIYLTGPKYAGGNGNIEWVDGKPFVSIRESLWSANPAEIAARINLLPADPESPEGYTIVNVHPWSHTMADVKAVVDKLEPHVRVVNPEEFFLQLIFNQDGRFPTTRRSVEANITNPINREAVRGIIVVNGNASSAAPIRSVQVAVGDGPWREAEPVEEDFRCWQASVDTGNVEDGLHALRVRVTTEDGEVYYCSEEIVVRNDSESGTVVGTVMRAGLPVEKAEVELMGRHAVTDSHGSFEFEFVPSGIVEISVAAKGSDPLTTSVEVVTACTSAIVLNLPVEADLRTAWTFDRDEDGWKGGAVSGEPAAKGKAKWDGSIGNGPGSLRLDGTDSDSLDGKANSWHFNVVKLPDDVGTISFDTRGIDAKGKVGGALRLVLVDDDGCAHVLLPWQATNSEEWVTKTADISAFAGQIVAIRFELDAVEVGVKGYRYIDNIVIK